MKELTSAIENYLESTGQLQLKQLGPREEKAITREHNQRLAARLSRRRQSNDRIVIIATAVLCVLFVLGIALLLYYRDNPTVIWPAVGGMLASNLGIVASLRRLWIEKTLIDSLLVVAAELPPEQAAKYIVLLYWNLVKQPNRGSPG